MGPLFFLPSDPPPHALTYTPKRKAGAQSQGTKVGWGTAGARRLLRPLIHIGRVEHTSRGRGTRYRVASDG